MLAPLAVNVTELFAQTVDVEDVNDNEGKAFTRMVPVALTVPQPPVNGIV